jgi:hypothetical protein
MKGSYQCKLGQGFLKGGVLGWMAHLKVPSLILDN